MGEISYRPIIDDMVWSYSRVSSFEDCRYKFFMHYILNHKEEDMFYASYGSFIHKLIENYYLGIMNESDMLDAFITGFSSYVKGDRPKASIVENYINLGIEYLKGFKPFPYKMIAVEKKLDFVVEDIKMVGIIDFLGMDGDDYVIVDNKSRNLKPRSKRKKPTKNDEELDSMLKQLYIYAGSVNQHYGKFPKYLCFNCFKNGEFIVEPFNMEAYEAAIRWLCDTVKDIKECDDFYPDWEYFRCTFLCGVNKECEYHEMLKPRSTFL